jgi:hypothetical protein
MGNRSARILVAGLGALLLGAGCATPRFVSDTFWASPDVLYVAYSEGHGSSSRVEKCLRGPDNRLKCEEQYAVDEALAK